MVKCKRVGPRRRKTLVAGRPATSSHPSSRRTADKIHRWLKAAQEVTASPWFRVLTDVVKVAVCYWPTIEIVLHLRG